MQGWKSRKFSRLQMIIVLECVILCLMLPGCFREKQEVMNFSGSQFKRLETENTEYISPEIDLFPGVYQICVYSDIKEQGQTIVAELICDSSFFHDLRENAVTVFANQDYVDFEAYVSGKISDAYIKCSINGADTDVLKFIKVYRTNLGRRMLLFLMFVGFLVLDLLIWWRRRLLNGEADVQQVIIICVLFCAVLCVYFPHMSENFYSGYDGFFHITRFEGLKESLLSGCSFPVRVQDYWLYGHGYSVSMFYGDIFMLFPAFLRILGFPLGFSYKAFLFAVITGTAGISFFSLYKVVKDQYAALLGSVGYLLFPYHIYDIYTRGAVGECLGMMFMPLVCSGMYLLYTEDRSNLNYKKYKWYLVVGLSAILQSHLISMEMIVLFIILTCVLFWKRTFKKETLLQLSEAAGITLAVNCWFWLPMLYMMFMENFNIMNLINRDFKESGTSLANILQLLPSIDYNKSGSILEVSGSWEVAQIGAGTVAACMSYFSFLLYNKKTFRNRFKTSESIFLGFSFLTLIMSTKWFPWNVLRNLPTRFLMMTSVFIAMFEAFAYMKGKKEGWKYNKISFFIIILLTFGGAIYQVNDISLNSSSYLIYTAENIGTGQIIGGEYLIEESSITDFYAHDPVAEDGLIWGDYKKQGTGAVIFLSNETEKERWLELPLIGYKGYTVENISDEEKLSWITEKRGEHGDLRMLVPAGYAGYVRVWYEGLPIFHVAEIISLITVLGIILFYLFCLWKQKKGVGENE